MDNDIENILSSLHSGQWYGFSDIHNKSFSTLIIHDNVAGNTYLTEHGQPTQQDWDGWMLQNIKNKKCGEIDTDTKNQILALASEPKQRNLLAKAIEIQNKIRLGTNTIDDDNKLLEIENIWIQIETLINNGNNKEQQIQNATTIEEINTIYES